MTDSGILVVHLPECIPEDVVRAALAQMLRLAIEELAPLEVATPATQVPYHYASHSRGFRTTIELYAGRAPEPAPRSDLQLAQYLARRFAQDALISTDGNASPYRWLLVRPDGTTIGVTEVPPDGDGDDQDDGIVIAERSAQDGFTDRR
jgi:hypothetical protein